MSKDIKFDARNLISDADMVLFSLSELGCFIRLKAHYWINGDLPSDALSLAKLAGCSLGQFQDVWPKVGQHFEENEAGKLICPELDKAKRKAVKLSERMSEVAKCRWRRETAGAVS